MIYFCQNNLQRFFSNLTRFFIFSGNARRLLNQKIFLSFGEFSEILDILTINSAGLSRMVYPQDKRDQEKNVDCPVPS